MRKAMLAMTVVLMVSGCATPGGSPTTVADQIKNAQYIATQICGFLPTVATVANLFGAGLGSSLAVAQAICAAVAPPSAPPSLARRAVAPPDGARRAGIPTVRGIPIRGHFVR